MEFSMSCKRAAVIGAGMSGISAANALLCSGWEVVVFEKSRGWGGRCATKRIDGCIVDHGAQYFTLRHPDFEAAVREACGDDLRLIEAPVVDAAGYRLETGSLFHHAEGNSRLARALGAGVDVRTGMELREVWDRRIGEEAFDLVVSTAPWPQTCKLAGVADGKNPYAPCLAVILVYDSIWPGSTRDRYAFRDETSPDVAWSACENHKPGRIPDGLTVIVAHASEEFSRTHLEEDPNCWSVLLRQRVEELWGLPAETFRSSHPHRWRYARVVEKISPAGLPDGWIFAGDLLESSRVESAWLAGRKAVAGIL
jgi:predicted NAD/FAD-dependent oxidoreductase